MLSFLDVFRVLVLMKIFGSFVNKVFAFFAAVGVSFVVHAQSVGVGAVDAPKQRVSVWVDGKKYEQSDLQHYVDARIDLKSLVRTSLGWEAIAREFAMARALELEGGRRGIDRSDIPEKKPGDPMFMAMDLYADKVYQAIVSSCKIGDDEKDLKRYYDEHPAAFSVPARVRLQRIMLPFFRKVDIFDANTWLSVQAQAIAMGGVNFDAVVARARELEPSMGQGHIGWQYLIGNDPMIAALREAKAGNMVGPMRVGDVVVLLKVEEVAPSVLLPWEEVRIQARAMAEQHCQEEQKNNLMRDLFERYQVKVTWEAEPQR